MWGFCKNKCVKWKKQILDVQNGKIYAQADVIALTQKTSTFVLEKICKYTQFLCKRTVTMHICTVTVHVQMIFFILFFSLLYQTTSLPLCLQQPAASPTSTITQHGRIRRRKKKITTQLPNPAPPPNIATQHRKLPQNQQKINPKSTKKQLENPTQNQDKPTGKPNSKSIKTHWETQPKDSPNPQETQPKPYSTENSREKPNRAESAVGSAATAAT